MLGNKSPLARQISDLKRHTSITNNNKDNTEHTSYGNSALSFFSTDALPHSHTIYIWKQIEIFGCVGTTLSCASYAQNSASALSSKLPRFKSLRVLSRLDEYDEMFFRKKSWHWVSQLQGFGFKKARCTTYCAAINDNVLQPNYVYYSYNLVQCLQRKHVSGLVRISM